MEELICREGTVHSVIFQNAENGYTVLRLLTEEGEVVTVVGCIPCVAPGEHLTVTGTWEVHPQHGEQLKAQELERTLPEEEEDIFAYLSSGICKGVGPTTARRIVERFGPETLDVLEREPERLNLIKGIWNGIGNAASWLWNKVSGFCSNLLSKIKGFFGISSPSREMAWVGDMLTQGLAGGIEDGAGAAISAAEDLNNGILGVMNGLAVDMQSAVPSNFAFDASGTVGSVSGSMGGVGGSSFGTLITIQQMIVRSEDDIRRISQELYNLIQTGSRAQGRFSTA